MRATSEHEDFRTALVDAMLPHRTVLTEAEMVAVASLLIGQIIGRWEQQAIVDLDATIGMVLQNIRIGYDQSVGATIQ